MCRRKRREKFLKIVRHSDKPGSKVWICKNTCSDGRMHMGVQSLLQDRQSNMAKVKSFDQVRKSNEDPERSFVDQELLNVPKNKVILDVSCGKRMFWFNKKHPNTIFSDIKSNVAADVVQDFRNLKYRDKSFKLVVFDPPHLFDKKGEYSWLNDRYGTMDIKYWHKDLEQGFMECMRVLKDYGILIFKWSEGSISVSTILSLCPFRPLFGHTSDKKGKTHWLCFMKFPKSKSYP